MAQRYGAAIVRPDVLPPAPSGRAASSRASAGPPDTSASEVLMVSPGCERERAQKTMRESRPVGRKLVLGSLTH